MNILTIILSITSALLVAVLVLVWQEDSNSAKNEPKALQAQVDALTAKVKSLEAKSTLHTQAQSNSSVTSPYSSSLQGQAQYAADSKSIQERKNQIARLNDKLERSSLSNIPDPLDESETSLASQEITTSALDSINSSETAELVPPALDTPTNAPAISEDKQQKRIRTILNSKVYATVEYVESENGEDIILAQLDKNISISTEAILSIRRNSGIAGKLKITSIQQYPGKGDVATLQKASRGFGGAELKVLVGDELILTPAWE